MKVQVDWLKEYVEIDAPAAELGHVLTMAGLEIESHELLDEEKGDVLELNVTPNRGYCLSHLGVAREVSALMGGTFNPPDALELLEKKWGNVPVAEKISVENQEEKSCPRYAALVIENVRPGPSPKWLCDRLMAIGLRPINNIVDITNFVMMEYGQPLHAFDRDLLSGNKIIIRNAKNKEPFTSLDGSELKLEPDALVIADAEKPVALAGIMGGVNSQVSETTQNVVLESACFDSATIRKASKKYGLRSDSSYRFERGVDIDAVITAQARAACLIQELAGGEICKGRIDLYPKSRENIQLSLRVSRVNQLLGSDFKSERIGEIISRLGLKIKGGTDSEILELEIPGFRPDLTREVDVIEEIARVDGFDKVATVFPIASVRPVRITPKQKLLRKIRGLLCHTGFSETVHFSFIEREQAEGYLPSFAKENDQVIPLKNPLSSENDTMRTSLVPGLLKTIANNLSKGQKPLKLFEIGSVYCLDPQGNRIEKTVLTVAVLGAYELTPWKPRGKEYDFYDLKGALEQLCSQCGLQVDFSVKTERSFLLPGKSVNCNSGGEIFGYMGELLPEKTGVTEKVFAWEIDLQKLEESLPPRPRFQSIAKFPETYRDVSILVDRQITSQQVSDLILKTGHPLLSRVELYDHFEGKKIQSDKKSLTFALSFQSKDKTLSDEEVNPLFESIIQTLKTELDASLRE
ncbi:MAG: phenylalanine--tRNA ligase subunit beta [Nitrospinae bacterium]|nr:phenylalanine--tRNA ligase subunit beta [Nitrospinota bacterium]